jgi:hypothetical protein
VNATFRLLIETSTEGMDQGKTLNSTSLNINSSKLNVDESSNVEFRHDGSRDRFAALNWDVSHGRRLPANLAWRASEKKSESLLVVNKKQELRHGGICKEVPRHLRKRDKSDNENSNIIS